MKTVTLFLSLFVSGHEHKFTHTYQDIDACLSNKDYTISRIREELSLDVSSHIHYKCRKNSWLQ